MVTSRLSPEVKAMRLRLRHIHIPDLPPLYAPRFAAPMIRDFLHDQIKRMRAASEADALQIPDAAGGSHENMPLRFSRPTSSFDSWIKCASPPPTVLSFTRRPTYILPKHQLQKTETWQAEYLTNSLKSRMEVKFYEPPKWSPLPWLPLSEQGNTGKPPKIDPLRHEWPEPDVMIMPCAEAMYHGPGQVSMWPIMDLRDDVQRGTRKFNTKYEYERILEDTTIQVLKREYGIEAFAIPGASGVWVESKIPPPELGLEQGDRSKSQPTGTRRDNLRRIATIHASVTDDITHWGVSIHVGQPDPVADAWTSFTNPWTPIRQHTTTTSIAAELAHIGASTGHGSRTRQLETWSQRKSKYLQVYFDKEAPFAGTLYHSMPYNLIKVQDGRRETAPLGLDNREVSTVWTYEFARQLGMHDGFVDHYGVVNFSGASSTDSPTKTPQPGFLSRSLLDEHWLTKPYDQVDVPSIQLSMNELVSPGIIDDTMQQQTKDKMIDPNNPEGWMLSWPLWLATVMKKLDQSIAGGAWDTRRRTLEWEKEQAVRQTRRKASLRDIELVQQQWGAGGTQLIRRPLTDEIVRKLAERARRMEQILRDAPVKSRKSQELLQSTAQMRSLLETRFFGGRRQEIDEVTAPKHGSEKDEGERTPPLSSPSVDSPFLADAIEYAIRSGGDWPKPDIQPVGGKRTGYVKFTETRNEQWHSARRRKGIEKAAQRREARPDAVTHRLATSGGTPSFLPNTQKIGFD
ncbi:Putative lipoyltransferase-like protein, chloroplastic [Cytospora mali]|uniref:Lipoyltransferase-like protein, chloroplastic n=1 Tax=Cytospora mali TaxID=578113 RepID=A0A194W1K9_CYTMA|nr:Putative lipoyltransferase-like protein, chloroplastic [Valsa mali]